MGHGGAAGWTDDLRPPPPLSDLRPRGLPLGEDAVCPACRASSARAGAAAAAAATAAAVIAPVAVTAATAALSSLCFATTAGARAPRLGIRTAAPGSFGPPRPCRGLLLAPLYPPSVVPHLLISLSLSNTRGSPCSVAASAASRTLESAAPSSPPRSRLPLQTFPQLFFSPCSPPAAPCSVAATTRNRVATGMALIYMSGGAR